MPEDSYSGDTEMFDAVHAMRTRIITDPAFTGERILGAILFEDTMDRQIEGRDTAEYLWDVKGVVPFLKVDKGLADEADGVQVMKPIDGLDALLARAVEKGVFGTKMRSVIKHGGRGGRRRDRRAAVRRSARRSPTPGSCRSWSPRSTSTARRRPRPRSCCTPRSPRTWTRCPPTGT